MFVLPPPPRYPSQPQSGAAGGQNNAAPPMIVETNNTLTNPTGPECEFLVGEGTYILREELTLATPPPHPSEAPVLNPNPLSTTPQAATAGTRLSLVRIEGERLPPFFYKGPSATTLSLIGPQESIQEHPNEGRYSTEAGVSSDEGRGTSTSDAPGTSLSHAATAPAFGEGTALLPQGAAAGKAAGKSAGKEAGGKKKKPKNNMTKSSSSFISRVIVNELLSRKLSGRPGDGVFAFANINRAFQWLDFSSPQKNDYLTKILFTKAHCLCHDVNSITKTPTHIDLIMGFSTGEIIWYEPMTQRYTRLNKNGIVNSTPVSEIRWIPGSENLFLASHMDGSLVVYDKEKEDAPLNPEEEAEAHSAEQPVQSSLIRPIQIVKSVHSKNQKSNPVASWKLSNQRINAYAFSPNNEHLAVVSEDGSLRIINYLKEELEDLFYSYYGGLTCVCWSPDGKYVLTGGQDDLISIWSVVDSVLVARCQGHESWVSAVAFDPWRCDGRNYRFGSVGEDCRLCLWDFSVSMLHRPKAQSVRQRGSISSKITTGPLHRSETANTWNARLRSNSNLADDDKSMVQGHPVEPRSRTATLPPILNKVIDVHPVGWLEFTEECVITAGKSGRIKFWDRPSNLSNFTEGE